MGDSGVARLGFQLAVFQGESECWGRFEECFWPGVPQGLFLFFTCFLALFKRPSHYLYFFQKGDGPPPPSGHVENLW